MPFPWLDSRTPKSHLKKLGVRRDEAIRHDVTERARMLLRLGRTEAESVSRCKANLAWEYGQGHTPGAASEVEALVHQVYARRG